MRPEALDDAVPDAGPSVPPRSLSQRVSAVVGELSAAGATRVVDLGCGEGPGPDAACGTPPSPRCWALTSRARALEQAERRLQLDRMPDSQRARLRLLQSSLTYRDDRLAGFDAAVLMEVIEHLDPARLPSLELSCSAHARPRTVLVTTPNAEYNVRYRTPARRRVAASGPSLRMDPGGIPRLGAGGRRVVMAIPSGLPASATATRSYGAPTPTGRFQQSCSDRSRMQRETTRPAAGLTRVRRAWPSPSSAWWRWSAPPVREVDVRGPAFRAFEVISSDFCRGLVSGDENDQSATKDAFEVLNFIAGKRLAAGRLTVIDATNVQRDSRRQVVELAKAHDVLPVAIVLMCPRRCAWQRNRNRPDREFGAHVVRRQRDQLRRSLRGLAREGFRKVHVLRSVAEIDAVSIVRETAAQRLPRPARAVRRHRRRARLPGGARDAAAASSATCCPRRRRAAGRRGPSRPGGGRSSSATWSTAARTRRGCSGW